MTFIAGQLGLGGAERQLVMLLEGLDRARWRASVISLGPYGEEHWTSAIRRLNVPLVHVARGGRARRVWRVARHLRAARAHIVHGWVLHANPYAALAGRLAGVPLRLGSMRESHDDVPDSTLLQWTGFRGLDALIVNSSAAAGDVKVHRRTRARLCVVPNGVAVPQREDTGDAAALRRELGCPERGLVMGTIGRLDHAKNHDMLLHVAARLVPRWPSLCVVIIGDGPRAAELRAQATALGIADVVVFAGPRPQAARFLPAFDVACLTSLREGMPNVVMEASAAGVPIVSTRAGGASELIDDGRTGRLLEAGDIEGMATTVDTLLRDEGLRRRMGEQGRRRMAESFSPPRMAERMMAIYDSLMEARPA